MARGRDGAPFPWTDGEWRGQAAFIIGGGPSVRAHGNLREIVGKGRIIAVNRALELELNPDMWVWIDDIVYEWAIEGKLGQRMRTNVETFTGVPVCRFVQKKSRPMYPENVVQLNWNPGFELGPSIEEGSNCGNNTGFWAMNLAYCLGADPIILIGFDCHGRKGKQAWYHDGYPKDPGGAGVYDSMRHHFSKAGTQARELGLTILNASPGSSIPDIPIIPNLETAFWKIYEMGKLPTHERDQVPALR